MNESISENLGIGYLIVRVTTAQGAVPIEGATVYVFDYNPEDSKKNGNVVAVRKTDYSGLTGRIPLPAPPRSMSQSRGDGTKPYSNYNINVDYDGYYLQSYINVPIFDGVVAVQVADLIPLPEDGRVDTNIPDDTQFFESENPDLEGTEEEYDS